LRKFESESVIVTGRVDSVEPYLDQAAVVAAPLRLGGGMRVKVLEALAAGKAVVASTRALEGLSVVDGQHVLVADSEDEFVLGISQLLENREMRMTLATEGRRWAAENLSWQSRLQSFERLYDRLLGSVRLEGTQAPKIPEQPAL
jgi:glycosyltransferase involved in cell wall biosynthesis